MRFGCLSQNNPEWIGNFTSFAAGTALYIQVSKSTGLFGTLLDVSSIGIDLEQIIGHSMGACRMQISNRLCGS